MLHRWIKGEASGYHLKITLIGKHYDLSILEMSEWKHSHVKQFPYNHIASKWQLQNLNLEMYNHQAILPTPALKGDPLWGRTTGSGLAD